MLRPIALLGAALLASCASFDLQRERILLRYTPDTDVLDVAVDYKLNARVSLGVGYVFDRYRIQDWQQEANAPWFESVGSEYLLRDTSRSYQWGNRLFNLGSYLAPGYEAHVGYVTMSYRF